MSVTVNGCVNSDGSITFENLETCLEQSACRVPARVPAVETLHFAGTLTPDVTGDYAYKGQYAGQPYYFNPDKNYYLWRTEGIPPEWCVTSALGDAPGGYLWRSVDKISAGYYPMFAAEGIGTMTLVNNHAGQIALMLSGADNEDCNDTFYGCYNPTTGKFQIVIPENCCAGYPECPCSYNNVVPDCYGVNKTPIKVLVVFHGITLGEWSWEYNDQYFCLTYQSTILGYYWYYDGGSFEIWYHPHLPIGDGGYFSSLSINLSESGNIFYSGYASIEPPVWNEPCATSFENMCLIWPYVCLNPYSGTGFIFNTCDECLGEIWITDHYYAVNIIVKLTTSSTVCYKCILAHISNDINKPPNLTYWEVVT